MSLYARFNSTNYKLRNRPSLNFSSRETTFTNIVIDFSGKTSDDLPIKYQEIQILDTDTSEVLYYGYCSQPTLPKFDGKNERVLLEIELLSPQTYLTKRTIEITLNKINIHDAVEDIVGDLVDSDSFTIEENDLPTTEYLSDIFLNQTIEKILSNLGGRFNFIWYVDELKGIHFRYLPNIEGEDAVLCLIDFSNTYLKSIRPSFEVSDYCNKLNLSNVSLITASALLNNSTLLDTGQMYNFTYPFSISPNVCYRLDKWTPLDPNNVTYALIMSTDAGTYQYTIEVDLDLQTITYSSEIGFLGEDDDDVSKKILLQRDISNPNLIIGFKWAYSSSETTDAIGPSCNSYSTIVPFNATYLDPSEVNNSATKINTSGLIEKEVDLNNKYFTQDELTAYAKSLFRQNNKQANIIDLEFQGDTSDSDFIALKDSLLLTKKIYANLPNYFVTENDYAITDISYVIDNNIGNLMVSARSSNASESYIDIFRLSDEQLTESDLLNKIIAFYNQDDKTVILDQVIVNGDVVNQ